MFTASTTGLPERWSIPATSWSAAVMPVLMSHTKTITVAEEMAISACSRMKDKIWSSVPGSMPPVSTRSKVRPRHSASAYRRSRVTPGVSSTMDRRFPVSLLNSMDLPTLGRPTMATRGFNFLTPNSTANRTQCKMQNAGMQNDGVRLRRRFYFYFPFRFVFPRPYLSLVFPPPAGAETHKRIGIILLCKSRAKL